MRIAVLGLGPIGSTFAFHLARAGHEVTGIARNKRFEQVKTDGGIVTVKGERAAFAVEPVLDSTKDYDLVLVTVLAHQVDVVLPALKASAAKQVMFMFNTFEPLARLRDVVGPERFAFGFPAILATLPAGRLAFDIVTVGQVTLSTDARWAKVFSESGIKTELHPDLESWLRTHAVLVAGLMTVTTRAYERNAGVTWTEATDTARAVHEGLSLVRALGNEVTPSVMNAIDCMPTSMLAALLWSTSRSPLVKTAGSIGAAEPRALIDAMVAMKPELTTRLRNIRP
ncbi:MAG: 2-dehydropantoate 2-reductase [Archangium gephyra]|uniref:2-dehydropantoate 2-reductase n=1 Tax=Archangium gephyra TaxID=48 RepID=A0A2W5T8G6_9BACT|nr:MAG: 2-dehydropantoate 2-reductase [Archangium gephyra]